MITSNHGVDPIKLIFKQLINKKRIQHSILLLLLFFKLGFYQVCFIPVGAGTHLKSI